MFFLKRRFFFVFAMAVLFVQPLFAASPAEVTRISVDELKARLDRGDDIVILDVRSPKSYARSMVRIKGAVRIAPRELDRRARELPMGKEIVTYCT